jgi:ABC-type ATPase involved in cell division
MLVSLRTPRRMTRRAVEIINQQIDINRKARSIVPQLWGGEQQLRKLQRGRAVFPGQPCARLSVA